MYKFLLNITKRECNSIRFTDNGFTMSRMSPFMTSKVITPQIKKNLKNGLIIDIYGNSGVEVPSSIKDHNDKILHHLRLVDDLKVEIDIPKVEDVKVEDVKVEEPEIIEAIIQEDPKEEVIVKEEEKPKSKSKKAQSKKAKEDK